MYDSLFETVEKCVKDIGKKQLVLKGVDEAMAKLKTSTWHLASRDCTVEVSTSHKLSPQFSAFIIEHFEEECGNNGRRNDCAAIADILQVDSDTVGRIRNGELPLRVDQASALEKVCGVSVSSLLQKAVEGKQIPGKLQSIHEAFIEYSKRCKWLRTSSTEKTAKQLSILEQEEQIVEEINELKEKADYLRGQVEILKAQKIEVENLEDVPSPIKSVAHGRTSEPARHDEVSHT